jgi:hypothetical protein
VTLEKRPQPSRAASSAGARYNDSVAFPDSIKLPESTLQDLISDNRFLVVPETMVDGLIVIDDDASVLSAWG